MTGLAFNPLAVPTLRDEDLCHVSADESWVSGGCDTLCGISLDEDPCCQPGAPCGRPRCPECAMLARDADRAG